MCLCSCLVHTVYFLLQVTPFQPQVHKSLVTQWALKTEQIKHFQDSGKTHSYMDVSKQEGNYPSKINREKLTMFCEICSLSPRQVPQIPHAKELHSHYLQTNQKKEAFPWRLGTLSQYISLNANFTPNPALPRDPFLSRLCLLQTNMQMVGTQV